MVGTYPEAWEETALVAIALSGGTFYQYAAATETIEVGEGDNPGESIPTVSGGNLWKQTRQEDGEITLEIYPINCDTALGQGLFQENYGGTWDTTAAKGLQCDSDYPKVGIFFPRSQFTVCILWTNDTTSTTAQGAVDENDATAIRFWARYCRITSHKSSFTDGILKTTITLKYPSIAKAGTDKSYGWESTLTATTDTGELDAITA